MVVEGLKRENVRWGIIERRKEAHTECLIHGVCVLAERSEANTQGNRNRSSGWATLQSRVGRSAENATSIGQWAEGQSEEEQGGGSG